MILGVDIETCSFADIDDGASPYAQHETTRAWCAVFVLSDGPGKEVCAHYWSPRIHNPELIPKPIRDHILDGGPVLAHNASFEISIWKHLLAPYHKFPLPELWQWRCSLLTAAICNLPLSLSNLGAAIGARVTKDTEGQQLMLQLAKVKKDKRTGSWVYPEPTPVQLKRLIDYCYQDVLSMLECWWKLPKPPSAEQEMMRVDRVINERGMLIDVELALAMQRMAKQRELQIGAEVWHTTHEMCGLTAPGVLKDWLQRQGVELPKRLRKTDEGFTKTESVDRGAIDELLKRADLPELVRDVLGLRVETGRVTSLAKAAAVPRVVNHDNRLRWSLRYAMAHTGRWSSEGLQVHNLAKPTKSFGKVRDLFLDAVRAGDLEHASLLHPVLEGLSYSLRSLVTAPPGYDIIGGDYSAIEARVVAWLAGQQDALDAFADPSRDIYVEDAARCGSDNRDFGKEQRLGLGFGMGDVKLYERATARGVAITTKQARQAKTIWRGANPMIVKLWRDLQDAFFEVIAEPGRTVAIGQHLRVLSHKNGDRVYLFLPSGRAIYYWRPSVREAEREIKSIDEDGKIVVRKEMLKEIRFWTPGRRGMEQDSTYGGKLTENATQAVARDLLRDALIRFDVRPIQTYQVVIHVHDAIAAQVATGHGSTDEFCSIMAEVPSWAPGLPVAVEGYRSKCFKG